MPAYDCKCRSCGRVGQYLSTVEERYSIPLCACGGERSKIILTAPKGFVKGNFAPFKSPVDGSVIATDRALREHNTRNGVVSLHEGYDEAKVLSGDFGKKEVKSDKKELAKDIGESIYKLNQGYVPPVREAYDE